MSEYLRCPFCDNNPKSPLLKRPTEAAIIRAFVGRVEKRIEEIEPPLADPILDELSAQRWYADAFQDALQDELAAMENAPE